MVEAMIYILRTSCPWRDLPVAFGPWQSVYTRWRRWNESLLWPQILDLLSRKAAGKLECVDATHIKVHQDGSNPSGGQQNQAIGRTKGGLNSKITARVDAKGRAIQLALAPGQRADVIAAEDLAITTGKCVVADKGYDSDKYRAELLTAGSNACIPARAKRRNPHSHHRGWYRKRHRVENFFQRFKRFRRVATRYEKLDSNFFAFACLAAVLDWLK